MVFHLPTAALMVTDSTGSDVQFRMATAGSANRRLCTSALRHHQVQFARAAHQELQCRLAPPRHFCVPGLCHIRPGTVTFVGRNLFRTVIVAVVVFAFSSGVIQFPGLNVGAATKPKTDGVPCIPNQLSIKPEGALNPSGTNGYLVSLENVSKSSCTLEGYPQLRLLDAGGKSITTRDTHRDGFAGADATGVTLVTVRPGWSGLFAVTYPNSSGYDTTATCPISDHVEVHVPNMKEPLIFKWRIRPYGGKSFATPHCGEISVSFVYGPYRLAKSQLNDAA